MKRALSALNFILMALAPLCVVAQPAKVDASAWSAPPSASVIVEDKSFHDGAIPLDGTLYLPSSSTPAPAIVVFHAASVPTRDLALYSHLKQMGPALGIAVFVFDRRGSGKSVGAPANGDYAALADDGIAALRMLAQDPRIDAKRIGFWGLSQGGWISLLAAARCPETAFAIAVSAPMTTPDVQMNFAVANILRIRGYGQADIDFAISARRAVDDFERGKLDRRTTQKRVDAAAAKPWFDLTYLDRTFTDPDKSGWAREMRQDPMETLPQVKAPMLIIYGAADPWVPVALSIERLRATAAQHPMVTTAVVAGADHDMSFSTSLEAQIDPAGLGDQAPNAPEYFSRLAEWLTIQGLTRRAPRGK
jgi:pimeloyl-ACP methyl ester carboxylesterase